MKRTEKLVKTAGWLWGCLENNVDKAIEKVKKENYKNYFEYAYNLKEGYELKRKLSTRRRKLKIYK